MKESYRLTQNQKNLLKIKLTNESNSYQKYIEKIIFNHLLIEKGFVNEQKDDLVNKILNNTFTEYILKTKSESYDDNINKYSVGNYYMELAKRFNTIARKREITRNKLWKITKENIIFKNFNNTNLRLYKFIFRGEIIPSPRYVFKTFEKHEELPTYLSIIYLDEEITPELKKAYENIKIY